MKKLCGILLLLLVGGSLEASKKTTTKFPGFKPLLAALTNSSEYQKMSKLEQATLEHYVCATKNLILGIILVPVTLYCAAICLNGFAMYCDDRIDRKMEQSTSYYQTTGATRARSNSYHKAPEQKESNSLGTTEIAQLLAYYWAGHYSLIKSTDLLVDAFYRFGNGPEQRKKDETKEGLEMLA